MATEKELELLDNYVSNRLSVDDKMMFEKEIQTNHELQHELQLQQKLVESLRQARIAELKSMLNNVPTSALKGGSSAAILKTAIALVVAGLMATGGYIYFNTSEEQPQQPASTKEIKPEANPEVQPVQEQPKVEEQPKTEIATQQANAEKKQVEKTIPKKTKKVNAETEPVTKPALEVFDPSTEAEKPVEVEAVTKPASDKSVRSGSSFTLGIDNSNKKYTFHYQFKEDNLLLYGPFEKNFYEIMEFFSDNKRTIFLFYKDKYYYLKEENEKIKPLSPIHDPALLKKLKESRKK